MKDQKIVNKVIELLEEIEVDGETMEYIVTKVGLDEQLHKQLIMARPTDWTIYFLELRNVLDKREQVEVKVRRDLRGSVL